MKILFFTEHFAPETNAAASRIYERALYWVKWGHEVTVITSAPNFPFGVVHEGYKNRWYQVEILEGIRVLRVKTFMSRNAGFFLRTLDFISYGISSFIASFFQEKPDVIIASSPQFFAAVAGWAGSKVKRVPFVFELADLWPANVVEVGIVKDNWLIRKVEQFELFLYRESAAVISLSSAYKTNLQERGIAPEKIYVVINGVDMWRYTPREKDEELLKEYGLKKSFIVAYIGTHGISHGLINLNNAAELLKKEGDKKIKFLLIGPGAEKEMLVKDAKKRGLDNMLFLPNQMKSELPRYWSICDLAVIHLKNLPIYKTSIPSKMFEAMAMGLPILVATPNGEARKIVEKVGAGVWVPPDNPEMLVSVIKDLQQNRELYLRYKEKSSSSAPLFSRKKQAEDMIAVLENVTKKCGRP